MSKSDTLGQPPLCECYQSFLYMQQISMAKCFAARVLNHWLNPTGTNAWDSVTSMYVRNSHWLTFCFEYDATLDWLGIVCVACKMELNSIAPVSAQVKKIKRLFFTAHDITLLEDVIFHQ